MSKKFSTTIKQKYWDMKMEDVKRTGHFYEYKSISDFWDKRIHDLEVPCAGVFLIGSKVERVFVVGIEQAITDYIPEKYAGEIGTNVCWMLKCIPLSDAPPGETKKEAP